MVNVKQRDFSLDLLRAIAIAEVVLAHTQMPGWLFQLRNFGVPLLMLLSGWSIGLSMANRHPSVLEYIRKRVRRLVIPCWIFLSVYFLYYAVAKHFGASAHDYSLAGILSSFVFMGGVTYMWVIRINLLISLVTPWLLRVNTKIKDDSTYIAACLSTIVGSTILWMLFDTPEIRANFALHHHIITSTVFFLLGYGAIFAMGLRIHAMSQVKVAAMAVGSGVLFGVMAVLMYFKTGEIQSTQYFKYPPEFYYIAYALAASFTLIALRNYMAMLVPKGVLRGIVGFIGANTLWIYLWHILALDVVHSLQASGLLSKQFILVWLVLMGIAIGIILIQKTLVELAIRVAPSRYHNFLSMFAISK